jgi:hypothetical protein
LYAPQPPASPRKNSPLAIGLLIVATIGYGLSLLPWLFMLVMSPMLYDSPDNTSTATLLIIGLLGWPVAILAGLIVGWIRRTVKVAAIAVAAPLVWALVVMAGVEVANPSFFNAADFLPDPVVLNQADRELAGFALGADPATVAAALGAPDEARVDGETVAPAEAAAATAAGPAAMWTYTGKGLVIYWVDGAVDEVEAGPGWTGATPRDLKLGDSMAQATVLYGKTDNVTTVTSQDSRSETYRYRGKGFGLIVMGDTNGRVENIYLQVQN